MGSLFVLDSFLRVTASFILLCLISSAIYIINDLVDIESDRQHPKKRFRAIASGQLPIPAARGGGGRPDRHQHRRRGAVQHRAWR